MKKKLFLLTGTLVFLAAAIILIVELVIIPKKQEKDLLLLQEKQAEEERILQKEAKNAHEMSLFLDKDVLENSVYDGAFISMTDASQWSMELFSGIVGVTVMPTHTVAENWSEFMDMFTSAKNSGNELTYMVMVIDPHKLYQREWYTEEYEKVTKEKRLFGEKEIITVETQDLIADEYLEADFDAVFGENPDTEFRVFLPCYYYDYWRNLLKPEAELISSEYAETVNGLLSYDNVILGNYTAEDWTLYNEKIYSDKLAGGLYPKVVEKNFLYTYRDKWPMSKEKTGDLVAKIDKAVNKELLIPRYANLSDAEVVLLGDSIFELSDGPYSVASVIESLSGATTYNISKGGMTAILSEDTTISMPNVVNNFLNLSFAEGDEFEVMNRNIAKFKKSTTQKDNLYIVINCCINDYVASAELFESAAGSPSRLDNPENAGILKKEETYEGALKMCIQKLKDAYPQAKIIAFTPYYMDLYDNGTVVNELGYVRSDYEEVMRKVCSEMGVYCINMQDYCRFDADNTITYLDDGTHPSPAGCFEVAKALVKEFDTIANGGR